jgi:hypothetical protein
MIEKWFHELENKFLDIECGPYVVMPNHFHCIIENNGNGNPNIIKSQSVGADLCVRPQNLDSNQKSCYGQKGGHAGSPLRVPNQNLMTNSNDDLFLGEHIAGEHIGSPLHNVVQWFKTMSTNEYIRGVKTMGWQRFEGKLWQRGYWEHIIRDQKSFDIISDYIINNPQNWDTDKLKLS